MEALVLGAGAWGCSIGYHLARGGARVTVVDRGALASGSTGKAAGVISPLLWAEEDVALVQRSYHWFDEACCRGDSTLHHPGEVKLVRTAAGAEQLRDHARRWADLGLAVQVYGPEELRSAFPGLAGETFSAGAFVPEAGFADPYQMTAAMVREGRDHGLVLRQGLAVNGIRTSRGTVTAVETDVGALAADVYILAAGTWSRKLAAWAGVALPLKPYRAQALVTTPLPPQNLPVVHDASTGAYFFQEAGGGILVGDGTQESEFDPDGFSTEADFEFVSAVTGRLQEMLPAAAGASLVRGWAGLCGATPDRRPLVGFHRELSNLFVACGDNGFGFMRAPALGECAAAMIQGTPPPVNLRTFDVNRFRGDETFAIHQGFTLA